MSIRNGKVAYKSPIETIWSDIEYDYGERFDQMVLNAVQSVGIRVNKEELVKALAYDREQYRKGWEDRDSEIVRCNDCVFFESGIRCGLRNEQTDCNGFCSKGRRKKLMNEEEKEPVYCRECKHALLAEYNEGIDVCCLKGGKRKTVSMLDTCEEGEPNEFRNEV